jgi:hypothetical protein
MGVLENREPVMRRIPLLTLIGTLATIVAAYAGVSWWREQRARWDAEDRPQVVASELQISPATNEYRWTLVNRGKDDATKLRIKIAATDLTHTHQTLLTHGLPDVPRLKRGIAYPVTTIAQNDVEFLVLCLNYSNDRDAPFDDPPKFYLTPYYKQANRDARSEPSPVSPEQDAKLSAGFFCVRL